MNKFYYLMMFCLPALLSAQVIQSFDVQLDSSYWDFDASVAHNPEVGWIEYPLETEEVHNGSGAMRINYSVHDIETWGGYSAIAYMAPDDQVMDWSAYDSISFWYNNVTAQTLASRVHLRLNLSDASEVPNASSNDRNDYELWYSFNHILDDAPGWHEIKIPFTGILGFTDNNAAFYLTGWAGLSGNSALNPERIKGFTFEFSISGSGAGDVSAGTILIDNLTLKGEKNILTVNNGFEGDLTGWTVETSGEGATGTIISSEDAFAGAKYLELDIDDNTWAQAFVSPDFATTTKEIWKFSAAIKDFSESATGGDYAALKMQALNSVGSVLQEWEDFQTVTADWQSFSATHVMPEGAENLRIILYAAKNAGNANTATYGFDEIRLFSPGILDDVAPEAPASIAVSANTSNYYNTITWADVNGETGETYTIYASEQPITNLNDYKVEVVAAGVSEGTQIILHYLVHPLDDSELTYYYAITATDASDNTSVPGFAENAVTNTAEGIPTIALGAPANFVADGDISEWEDAGVTPFFLTPDLHFEVTGPIDNPGDLSASVYLAIDNDYLYIAADVIDNVYNYGEGNWWDQDAFELFIGLYDSRKEKHSSYQSESQPDYKFIFKEDEILRDPDGTQLYLPGSQNFYFEGYNPDYVFEAKISLDSLRREGDALFQPQRGMRIPIELYFHDNDGVHDGNLAYSRYNTDLAHQDPSQWVYTWIGDTNYTITSLNEPGLKTASQFSLAQNYPNPFNPSTQITYFIAKTSDVKLTLYNAAGQKLETIVNSRQAAGNYVVKFDGSKYASGIYFYKIEAGDFVQARKMLLVK
jgi:hypothetical protein